MLRCALCLPLLLMACQAPGTSPEPGSFSFVWLLKGPAEGSVVGEALEQAQAGHFANMEKQAEQGNLLLAGPLWPPRLNPDHRGIFIFAMEEASEARAMAARDPAVQAGLLAMEVEAFQCRAPLAELPVWHQAAVEASGVVDPEPGFHARPYVLVLASPPLEAEEAIAPLWKEGSLVFQGRLGSGSKQRSLFCFAAETPDEVRPSLEALKVQGVDWQVFPWFASKEVLRFRETFVN